MSANILVLTDALTDTALVAAARNLTGGEVAALPLGGAAEFTEAQVFSPAGRVLRAEGDLYSAVAAGEAVLAALKAEDFALVLGGSSPLARAAMAHAAALSASTVVTGAAEVSLSEAGEVSFTKTSHGHTWNGKFTAGKQAFLTLSSIPTTPASSPEAFTSTEAATPTASAAPTASTTTNSAAGAAPASSPEAFTSTEAAASTSTESVSSAAPTASTPTSTAAGAAPAVVDLPVAYSPLATAITAERQPASGPSLTQAEVVVCVGRGVGPDHTQAQQLAERLGGVLGATRVVCDEGWAPRAAQIGQTGVSVSPRLYIGLGVSGAIHHTSGITGASQIVAICDDPDAPIFELCDRGLVGKLEEILPELLKALP